MKTEQEKVLDIINNAIAEMVREEEVASIQHSFGAMWVYKLIKVTLENVLVRIQDVYNN